MADAPDSKSGDGNIVWVQVPPPAPKIRTLETSVSDFFMYYRYGGRWGAGDRQTAESREWVRVVFCI